jgi:S1-C subfamily serine protease
MVTTTSRNSTGVVNSGDTRGSQHERRMALVPSFACSRATRRTIRVTFRVVAFFAALAASGCAPTTSVPGSIGAVLKRDAVTGVVVAHEIPVGMAAERAGLRAGDRVKMIDGIHVDELDGSSVVRLLRGPVGTRVTLTVVRGEGVYQLAIVRQAPKVVPSRR